MIAAKILSKTKTEILELIKRAEEEEPTVELISKLAQLQKSRLPFYLTAPELDEILKWKLDKQYHRQAKIRKNNTTDNIKIITQAAFSVNHEDADFETALRLKLLCTLSGVEIPVASAILTLCFPKKYAVIDILNWRHLYTVDKNKPKTNYTTKEYNAYLKLIKSLAAQFDLTTQKMDLAIWQYERKPKTK